MKYVWIADMTHVEEKYINSEALMGVLNMTWSSADHSGE